MSPLLLEHRHKQRLCECLRVNNRNDAHIKITSGELTKIAKHSLRIIESIWIINASNQFVCNLLVQILTKLENAFHLAKTDF